MVYSHGVRQRVVEELENVPGFKVRSRSNRCSTQPDAHFEDMFCLDAFGCAFAWQTGFGVHVVMCRNSSL